MSTLPELESTFEALTAVYEAAKHDRSVETNKRIELAQQYRALHAQLLAARKEAAAAPQSHRSSASAPEMIGMPTLAELESKHEEYESIIDAVESDWTIPNAKKREMAMERVTLRTELMAARREAEAVKQREAWALEDEAMATSSSTARRDKEVADSATTPKSN